MSEEVAGLGGGCDGAIQSKVGEKSRSVSLVDAILMICSRIKHARYSSGSMMFVSKRAYLLSQLFFSEKPSLVRNSESI